MKSQNYDQNYSLEHHANYDKTMKCTVMVFDEHVILCFLDTCVIIGGGWQYTTDNIGWNDYLKKFKQDILQYHLNHRKQ